jgi:hypothetical protein
MCSYCVSGELMKSLFCFCGSLFCVFDRWNRKSHYAQSNKKYCNADLHTQLPQPRSFKLAVNFLKIFDIKSEDASRCVSCDV